MVIFEDLGDVKLYDCMVSSKATVSESEKEHLYREAVSVLAALQVKGSRGFNTSWCWDTPRYDQELMVERESKYFLRAFWRDMLGQQSVDGIEEELTDIACNADCGQDLFLHRDFQSRNIMVKDGKIRVIDFQGGRLGPVGYDLASLLIDPYVSISVERQEELKNEYTQILSNRYGLDIQPFQSSFPYLALQRNLQIVGAFAFLFSKKGKVFFADFITPSLKMLNKRLLDSRFATYTKLRKCVEDGVVKHTGSRKI